MTQAWQRRRSACFTLLSPCYDTLVVRTQLDESQELRVNPQ